MDKKVERKIALLHSAAGAAAGVVFGLYLSIDGLTILSVLMLGIIVAYPLKPLCTKLFRLSEGEFLLKEWVYKGYLLFFAVWIVVWVFVYNLP